MKKNSRQCITQNNIYLKNKVSKRRDTKYNKLIVNEVTIMHTKTSLIPNLKDFKDTKIFAQNSIELIFSQTDNL